MSLPSQGNTRFKLCLLGEGRSGKTSLLLRYVKDTFDDRQVSTIQASFLEKRLNVSNKTVSIAIWDTAGQERFHPLGPIYYRDANGALLVYDITDKESFTKVKNWMKELRKIVGNDILVCIVGNKCDLEKSRQVSDAEAEEYAASVGAAHFKTSAKTGRGVEEAFLHLAKSMLEKSTQQQQKSLLNKAHLRQRSTITVEDSDKDQSAAASGGCCSSS